MLGQLLAITLGFLFACPAPGRSFPYFMAWGFPTHRLLRWAAAPTAMSCSPSPPRGHRPVCAAPRGLSCHRIAAPGRAEVEVGGWAGSSWVDVMAAWRADKPFAHKSTGANTQNLPTCKERGGGSSGSGTMVTRQGDAPKEQYHGGVSGFLMLCCAGMEPLHAPPRGAWLLSC